MKSIIFNTEEVKAILDGRKSQFRKIITNKQLEEIYKNDCYIQDGKIFEHCMGQGDPDGNGGIEIDHYEEDITSLSSKYKVDDIIYVKETFCIGAYANDGGCETNGYSSETYISQCSFENNIIYYADAINECNFSDLEKDELPIWKPSVHMKKEQCRIFLKITNVRVERLQDIYDKDCIKEGVQELGNCTPPNYDSNAKQYYINNSFHKTKKDAFKTYWNKKAKDGYKYEDNPYVFVYEFERVNKE